MMILLSRCLTFYLPSKRARLSHLSIASLSLAQMNLYSEFEGEPRSVWPPLFDYLQCWYTAICGFSSDISFASNGRQAHPGSQDDMITLFVFWWITEANQRHTCADGTA